MIPNNQWTNEPAATSPLLPPHNTPRTEALYARDLGPVSLEDTSQGLDIKVWELRYTNSEFIILDTTTSVATSLFSDVGVSWVSLTFDQNGRPFVAYIKSGFVYARWYDPTESEYTIQNLGESQRCFCILDARSPTLIPSSDIIVAYTRDGGLYWRQQRDRFLIEYYTGYSIPPDNIIAGFGVQDNGRLGLLLGTPVESDNVLTTYVKTVTEALNSVQDGFLDMLEYRGISGAVGAQLDLVGKVVGLARNGRGDEAYRTLLYFKAFINNSEGTPDEILTAVKSVTHAESVRLWEHYPACVFLYSDGEDVSQAAEILKEVVPAGVDGPYLLHDSDGDCFTPVEVQQTIQDAFSDYLPEHTETNPISGVLAELYH